MEQCNIGCVVASNLFTPGGLNVAPALKIDTVRLVYPYKNRLSFKFLNLANTYISLFCVLT